MSSRGVARPRSLPNAHSCEIGSTEAACGRRGPRHLRCANGWAPRCVRKVCVGGVFGPVDGFADVIESIEESGQYQQCLSFRRRAMQGSESSPSEHGTDTSDSDSTRTKVSALNRASKTSNELGDILDGILYASDRSSNSMNYTSEPCGSGAGDRCCARLLEGVQVAQAVLDNPMHQWWIRGRCSGLRAFLEALEFTDEVVDNWWDLGEQQAKFLMRSMRALRSRFREVRRYIS